MELGLFPLDLVLVPGEQAPLHIFEERYKELIGECLESGGEFGLVLADEDGLRQVGTGCAVVEVLERFPDGRLNVVVEGRSRFRVVEMTSGRAFATADVELLVDAGEAPTADERERCLAGYHKVVDAAGAELEAIDPAAEELSFAVAGRIDFGADVKQELLETRSERARVVRLIGLLGRAAEAVAREREVHERASGNGRVEAL